jgi:hypothetical protein
MLQHVSVVQQIGLAVLLLAAVGWVVGLVRVMRRDRFAVSVWRAAPPVRDAQARKSAQIPAPGPARIPSQIPARIPAQRGHSGERVELTPAEKEAFAGLVRRLTDDRS